MALSTRSKTKRSYTKALIINQISIYVAIIVHAVAWHVYGIHTVSKLCPFVFGEAIAHLEFNASIVFWLLAFGSAPW